MTYKTAIFGALIGVAFATTSAMADVYECKVRRNGMDGGIPPLVVFAINADETEALVHDSYIMHYHGKPIVAQIVVANSKRYTLKWTVKTVRDSTNQPMPGINYRATYLRGNHRFTLTGFPIGYDNQFNGTGSCKRTK